jgi:hypothetical protein
MTNGLQNVTATPYSQEGGLGDPGLSATVAFTIVNTTTAVTHFVLVDAVFDNDVMMLEEGMTIDPSLLPDKVNIRAEVGSTVKSVAFDLNGQMRTENVPPFAVYGDLSGDYLEGMLPEGMYTIQATPYPLTKKQGTAGAGLTLHFTVADPGDGEASVNLPGDEPVLELDGEELPEVYALHGNYPNPFNPSTRIAFSLPEQADVRLAVYDVLGREVAVLQHGPMPAGRHELTFDASGVPSGTYFYRMVTPEGTFVKQMSLLK